MNLYGIQGKPFSVFRNNIFLDIPCKGNDLLSDSLWEFSSYMPKKYSLSSPTNSILNIYRTNILYSLIYSYNFIDSELNIGCWDGDSTSIDKESLRVLKFARDIGYTINLYTDDTVNNSLQICNNDILRTSIKRGIYEDYTLFENDDIRNIYLYNKKTFYKKGYDTSKLEYILDNKSNNIDSHTLYVYTKIIINTSIRAGSYEKARKYCNFFKKISDNVYDIENSLAFLILKEQGAQSAKKHIIDNIPDLINLENYGFDLYLSLLRKNYGHLLDPSEQKTNIIMKCLTETPHDYDLWVEYFDQEGVDTSYIERKALSIIESGIHSYKVYKHANFSMLNDENIAKLSIYCFLNSDYCNAHKFSQYISDYKIKTGVLNVISE